ncbi:MAG: flagellar protein FlgN [Peptococcaceae bacterium]|nr:flagellar protein FlgN [Peptococcaceae bacterium]
MRDMTFLFNNLQYQSELHQHLILLEKDKQAALISHDNVSLDRIVGEEEQIIQNLHQLEADRAEGTASFTLDQGFNFSVLAKDYPEFTRLGVRLREEMTELQDINRINTQLIDSQLAYVNFSLQSIIGDTKPMYGSPGTLVSKPSPGSGISRGVIDHDA